MFYTTFASAAVAVIVSCSDVQSKQRVLPAKESQAVHVIELFTSEGCSSCPPADRLLSKLKAEGDSNVFVLSYHVDYWDRLGWKDPFSQAAFSERQRQYAQRFGLDGSYTPQVIVNGEEEFVGSDEKRLRASLAKSVNAPVAINARVERLSNGDVRLRYELPSLPKARLNAALVQAEADTEVKRGENEGKSLHHVNVVRELKTEEAQGAGTLLFHLPEDAANKSFSLILFVQQKDGGKITGAVQVVVPSQKSV